MSLSIVLLYMVFPAALFLFALLTYLFGRGE